MEYVPEGKLIWFLDVMQRSVKVPVRYRRDLIAEPSTLVELSMDIC